MRSLCTLVLAGTVLSLVAGALEARADEPHGLEKITGSFFLDLAEGADRGPLRARLRTLGAELRHEYRLLPRRVNVRGVRAGGERSLARLPGVVSVTPDYRLQAHLAESVPLIGADAPIPGTAGGSGIDVCVLDTGIDPDHVLFGPDPGRLVAWRDFVNGAPDPYDNNGHGTHVAAIVAGRDGLVLGADPFQGVAPSATLAVGKVLDAFGSGSASDVIAAIEWCGSSAGARVINLSLGGGFFSEPCDESDPTGMAQVINALAAEGILFVASAGNESNLNAVTTPACASGSMAVGATYDANVGRTSFFGCSDSGTRSDRITCFSNRWDNLDVVAPGCVIYSAETGAPSGVVAFCGTSQAAPHVSGVAALVMAAHPELSGAEVRACINGSARDLGDPGPDRTYGNGRIQAIPAVACDGRCAPTEGTEVSCADGADNDCDGRVDAEDPDCGAAPVCGANKDVCTIDTDCCSGNCHRGRCRGN